MKRDITSKTFYSMILTTLLALVLAACGSNSGGSNVPSYQGKTDQATINTGNAHDITTKALGVGFLDDISGSGGIAVKSLAKGLADPDQSLTPSVTKAAKSALSFYGDIFQGEFLPGDIFGVMEDADFPNLSDEGAYTRTITTEDDKTFTVTHTFDDAHHFSGTTSATDLGVFLVAYTDTFTGVVIETVTFNDTNVDRVWGDQDSAEKFDTLDSENVARVRDALACSDFNHRRQKFSNADTISGIESDKFGTGFDGYSVYNTTADYTYELHGAYATEEVEATDMVDNLGTETWTYASTFTGRMAITEEITDVDDNETETLNLTMINGKVSVNISDLFRRSLADGLITETSSGSHLTFLLLPVRLPDYDMEVAIQGDVSLITTESDDGGVMTTTLSLGNTAGDLLKLSKATSNKTVIDDDGVDETDDRISEDETLDVSVRIAGSAQLSTTFTDKTSDAEEAESLALSVTSGVLNFTAKDEASLDFNVEGRTMHTKNSQLTAALSGVIAASYRDEDYSLKGAITVESTNSFTQYNDDFPVESITKMLVTLDNLRLSANTFNLAFHGTLGITMDLPNREQTLEMNMVLDNNGKTFLFDNYLMSMSYMGIKGSKGILRAGIFLEGRFYHHDYGYVNVSTRGNTFVLGQDSLPEAGSLTVSGANKSTAILRADYDYDSDAEEDLFFYTVSVDEQGDGTYERVTEDGQWPAIGQLLDRLPYLFIDAR